ncbi:MAG: hypothetical protein JWM83_1685 [Candidatus Angelobacter sp.]|nr:hypothetical protein [Candidatus Angelobacter sp.]
MFIFRIAENSAEIKQVKVVVWGQFRAAVIQKELSHPMESSFPEADFWELEMAIAIHRPVTFCEKRPDEIFRRLLSGGLQRVLLIILRQWRAI